MKHTEKVIVPEHTKKVISHRTCDICKRPNDAKYGKDICELDETEISFRDVEVSLPECSNGTTYNYDICHTCFVDKVMPMLADLGAEPTVEEWDY